MPNEANVVKEHDPIRGRMVKAFIKTSITAALAAVIVVVALVTTSMLYSHALEYYGFAQGDIGYALEDFAETRSATRAIIGYDDKDIAASALVTHDEKKAAFQESMEDVAARVVNAEAYAELTNLKSVAEEYWALEDEIIELGSKEDTESSIEAQQLAETELDPMYDEIRNYLENMMNIKISDGNAMDQKLNILTWAMVILSVVLIAIAMFTSIRKGKAVAHRIAGSLDELSERLEAFADGDLTSEFPEFEVKDEINDMAENAAGMASNLKTLIEDVDYLIREVANGDFTVVTTCPERYVGEFAPLRESVIHLKNKMTETMRQIEAASDQVDCGSRQLAESATSLAEGSMEQAGSVEEMTATIVNVSNQSEATAKQIEEAYQKGLTYREMAEKGKEDIAQLVDAMQAINNVSIEIRNIIGDIETIAAQTNLLSLNASIEAARAGEAGKGFAVVASQIGTLASDSAQSAVRTRELIENSLQEIERGNEMMDQTNEVLQQVVEGIVFLSNASKDASEISYNNVKTMQELEEGIEEISGVVQNNSSSAEETSSTSEELAAQATTLKELVGQFKMNEI